MDFAAALVVAAVDVKSDEDSLAAPDLLKALCHYVEWRYHNELGLALEMLCYLGESCHVQLKAESILATGFMDCRPIRPHAGRVSIVEHSG